MFTGLIEATGEVAEVEPTPDGFRIRLTTAIAGELSPGDSLAVNGVCLTVVAAGQDGIHADISPETARVSALGALAPGFRGESRTALARRCPAGRAFRPGTRGCDRHD